MTYYEQMTNHIARLAQNPGWIDEMRRFTKELEACESGAWKGIWQDIKQRLEFLKSQQKNGGSND